MKVCASGAVGGQPAYTCVGAIREGHARARTHTLHPHTCTARVPAPGGGFTSAGRRMRVDRALSWPALAFARAQRTRDRECARRAHRVALRAVRAHAAPLRTPRAVISATPWAAAVGPWLPWQRSNCRSDPAGTRGSSAGVSMPMRVCPAEGLRPPFCGRRGSSAPDRPGTRRPAGAMPAKQHA